MRVSDLQLSVFATNLRSCRAYLANRSVNYLAMLYGDPAVIRLYGCSQDIKPRRPVSAKTDIPWRYCEWQFCPTTFRQQPTQTWSFTPAALSVRF